jgi:hypothetical protein
MSDTRFTCTLCKKNCLNFLNLQAHIGSKEHLSKYAKFVGKEFLPPTLPAQKVMMDDAFIDDFDDEEWEDQPLCRPSKVNIPY